MDGLKLFFIIIVVVFVVGCAVKKQDKTEVVLPKIEPVIVHNKVTRADIANQQALVTSLTIQCQHSDLVACEKLDSEIEKLERFLREIE